MPNCRAVVTGIGAITPLGLTPADLLYRWRDGRCAIVDGVGRCEEFTPGEHLSTREIRRTARFTQLALTASAAAVAQSRLLERLDARDVGCVIGTCFAGLPADEHELGVFADSEQRVSPLAIHRTMSNAPAAAIAIRYGLHGPTRGIATACAAGTDAIGVATRMIQCGDAAAVVAGGAESSIMPYTLEMGATAGAYSRTGAQPQLRAGRRTGTRRQERQAASRDLHARVLVGAPSIQRRMNAEMRGDAGVLWPAVDHDRMRLQAQPGQEAPDAVEPASR